jgi:sugar transferase (PEP-CTERM system associated)
MVKLFNVYFSVRSLIRLACEVTLIFGSFSLATKICLGADAYIGMFYESGVIKIACITILTVLFSYYFDLYEPRLICCDWEIYFRVFLVLSFLAFSMAVTVMIFPQAGIGRNVLTLGTLLLTTVLIVWRRADEWIVKLPIFRERVYVLGIGEGAQKLVSLLNCRRDTGLEVIGWTGGTAGSPSRELFAQEVRSLYLPVRRVDRLIIALQDRRGDMPLAELLELRLAGVVIEDACTIHERLAGVLPLEHLSPSFLIFSDGFRISAGRQLVHRLLSLCVASIGLLICLPLFPLIGAIIKLETPGPILFRQIRMGKDGKPFTAIKFRTMRQDAEANGAVWATANDPRVTHFGRFMRKTRLDEIPQLLNVLRGDMELVGPRPERPEFVRWLAEQIPYYQLRHLIRPGLTGWAQVRYRYGASVEDTRRKLEYDLYYLKHHSVGLDILIMFETIKTIMLRRGAQ